MTQKGRTQRVPADPLEQNELLSALGSSGYPLEIRLLKTFGDGGMDPLIGFRVPGQPDESTEIDIIAHFTRFISLPAGGTFRVTLRLLVEAKSLEPGAGFVGFNWVRPTEHELRVGRARFGGNPTYRVLPNLHDEAGAVIGPGGVAEAFDHLNSVPICVQWCVVRRTKPGNDQRAFAEHDSSFWKGMDGVVRASHWMMADHSNRRSPEGSFAMLFELPVLVVATPNLWLVDAVTDTPPDPVPRLALSRMFQLQDSVQHRLVDVVSEAGVPGLIDACRKTIDALEARVGERADALVELADQQRIKLEEMAMRAIAEEFRHNHPL